MAEILDLYDIVLLLNYERFTTEPRFRHAKLHEIATGGADPKTVKVLTPIWIDCFVLKTGMVFDKRPPKTSIERDLPSNMLPDPVPAHLKIFTEKQLETIFY
ncbi:hypothetical protein M422DRAFT_252455 [Sphaerobolus stellatus SS14]|uniref:Uncharacterized protein n=1 Tax=Sphaerobolus stellatus (strain SS14) TaxID=990650 RepID=A0A0C9UYS8_SPHS4|nr:hypothetical protein M422DRAFT_268169 [Sphaerobolus stellatus SS14]KIJ43962.1 hypothetical protein M422DRAFT_252455 [Sphaerobolus stellatus SS14]